MDGLQLQKLEGNKVAVSMEKEVVTTEGKTVKVKQDYPETTLEIELYKLQELKKKRADLDEQIKIQENFVAGIEAL